MASASRNFHQTSNLNLDSWSTSDLADGPTQALASATETLAFVAPSQTDFTRIDIREMAAAGYFQAIAYWLNEPLIPQRVYAQVLADNVPGRLKVLVEFEHPPQPTRLIRFVCDRLYKLNSDVIEGVYLIARALGTAQTDWEQCIRIPTATQRQQKRSQKRRQRRPSEPLVKQLAPIASRFVHEFSPAQIAHQVVRSQFHFFRASLISGTATAAFLCGIMTEFLISNRVFAPFATETVTPWYGDVEDTAFAEHATDVSFRPASRFEGKIVEAALERVAVNPHKDVANPSDPTVTLLFGGELSLNDFTFEAADDLDNLFSNIDIYKKADVAMVGLAEPLANASTSLQEDFYHRTRPQAVQALKAGGIDIVGLADEGNLTYGTQGLRETLENLDRQNILRVGAGRDQTEAHRPEILEVKGQRIAYLGYNSDAIKEAKAEKAGVALTSSKERQHIIEDIKAIRSQVDWIVVNYRWGGALSEPQASPLDSSASETSPQNLLTVSMPEKWQKSLAREAVDAGADLVVGYHPQHIQGAEIYHDRAIAYSLGDFVFNEGPFEDHDTAALRVSLRNQKMKVEFLPVTIRDSKLQMATGKHGAAILQTIRDASSTFNKPMHFPMVLDAKPNRFLPPLQHKTADPTFETEALPPLVTPEPVPELVPDIVPEIDEPEIDESWPSPPTFNRPLADPWSNPTEEQSRHDAPHPMMRESDALFMPAEKLIEENPIEEQNTNRAPTDQSLTDDQQVTAWRAQNPLEKWGEKKVKVGQEFLPIPAGTTQRQQREGIPENGLNPAASDFIAPL